ncbi:MAG: hypothetical protein Q4B87_03450 [Candidatus Saccharibacteria bacterium]|nr:hypothetical protein [Candidatus Saccharibacteria bacterium]
MENRTYLGGSVEMAIGTTVIEAPFLGTLTPNFVEGTRSTTSQAGVITQPSGLMQTAQLDGNYILPSMDALKALYSELYEEPLTEGVMGRIRVGGGTCKTKSSKVVNVHFVCDDDSSNDLHIYAGLVQLNLNFTYDAENNIVVPFTIFAQPTENGYSTFGSGDLSQRTLWDAATQTWVPVEES